VPLKAMGAQCDFYLDSKSHITFPPPDALLFTSSTTLRKVASEAWTHLKHYVRSVALVTHLLTSAGLSRPT